MAENKKDFLLTAHIQYGSVGIIAHLNNSETQAERSLSSFSWQQEKGSLENHTWLLKMVLSIVTLFTIAESWTQSKCPLMGE